MLYSSFTYTGDLRVHVPESASQKPPCESVCMKHMHIQNQEWKDAENVSSGRQVTDHLVKTVMVIKGNRRYKMWSLS